MKLENINKEQQLYVLKCGSILSSYGLISCIQKQPP